MAELPSDHDLAVVERSLLNALLEDHGSPAWQATYDHAWERDRATWDAVDEALRHGLRARPDGRRITSPPRWLDGLVNRRLRDLATNSWVGGFDQVRLLERLGLVAPPHDDVYVLAAVSGVKEPREQLAKDPALRAAIIWRLFEVEGGGQVSLANVDKYGRQRWRSALLALVAEGTLPRERVRVACLDALRRDFNHYRAAWFSATYLAFEPTREELAADQERLRGLLRSDVPATVSFALRQLQVIHKAGRLEPAPTIRALSPVVLARAKGTALAGLRLTESLAGQSEQLRSMAIEVARLGLQHEGSDVQAASARLLTKYGADLGDGVNLAPSVQSELGVSGTTNGFDVEQVPTQALRPPPDPATGADLVERLAALLEDASDAGELEAVLAGLAVLDEPEVLAPLRKRARAVHRRGPDSPLRAAMAALVLATEGAPFEELVLPQMRFVLRRIEGVAARLRGDRARDPLLAAPDAAGGFVRASTVAARLSEATVAPDPFDVIAARLRLHPDDVAGGLVPSLSAAGEVSHDTARIIAELRSHTWTDKGRTNTRRYYDWGLAAADDQPASADERPTIVLARPIGYSHGYDRLGDWIDNLAAIWPHNADHYLALTAWPVLDAAGYYPESRPDVIPVLDVLARHPGQLGHNSAVVLAAGLCAAKAEQRLHAVDAFLALVAPGRMPPASLATAMAAHTAGFTITRWASSLRDAATAPSGTKAVLAVLTTYLPQIPGDTAGVYALLAVFREECLRHRVAVTDAALRTWLAAISGGSRAARTAQALLTD